MASPIHAREQGCHPMVDSAAVGRLVRVVSRRSLELLVQDHPDLAWTPVCERLASCLGLLEQVDSGDGTGKLSESVLSVDGMVKLPNANSQWLPLSALCVEESAIQAKEYTEKAQLFAEEQRVADEEANAAAKAAEEEAEVAAKAAAESARCAREEQQRLLNEIDSSWASSKGVTFPWELSVASLGGDVFKVMVPSLTMTYAEIRQQVAIQAGKDVRRISLMFENEQLPEDGTLRDVSDALDRRSSMQVLFTKILLSKGLGKRIKKEFRDLERDPLTCGARIEVLDSEIYDGPSDRWKVVLAGPADTPYENGTFALNVKFPLDYPFKPPHIVFTTKIWNPHIHPDGGFIDGNFFFV